jgi:polyhydroxyalkanoate synthesis regulator phasin
MFPAPENDDDSDTNEDYEEEEEVIPRSLQDILDRLERESAKAVHEALNPPDELVNGCRMMTGGEARRRIAEASKPYQEKMDEARQKFVTAGTMTVEEAKAIVPNIGDHLEDSSKKSEEGGGKKYKEAEKGDFVPSRVVTDEGFPVTKAGMERFFEINQAVDKRDQDRHGMYIYNDFSGYGVTEVLENTVRQYAP